MAAVEKPAADAPLPRMTWEEYLKFDAKSEAKYVFDNGLVTPANRLEDGTPSAMAGGSLNHGRICSRLGTLAGSRVPAGCEFFTADSRLRVPPTGRTFYSDGFITCGEVELFEDNEADASITNPKVIFEVASPSTAGFDRGEKFEHYMRLESLREYVIIEQDWPWVQSFHRRDDGDWLMSAARGLEASAKVRSLNLELPLAELYRDVTFPETGQPVGSEPVA
jgi:Uma2 family endonuclease